MSKIKKNEKTNELEIISRNIPYNYNLFENQCFEQLFYELFMTLEEMRIIINKLNKMGLIKEYSFEEYIDLLIECQKIEKKKGWENRVRIFDIIKKNELKIKDGYHEENNYYNKNKDFHFIIKHTKNINYNNEDCSIF